VHVGIEPRPKRFLVAGGGGRMEGAGYFDRIG
jgi:hypothetical protein